MKPKSPGAKASPKAAAYVVQLDEWNCPYVGYISGAEKGDYCVVLPCRTAAQAKRRARVENMTAEERELKVAQSLFICSGEAWIHVGPGIQYAYQKLASAVLAALGFDTETK